MHLQEWNTPPPLPTCIEKEDVELDYKPEDESIIAETGEEEHSGLVEAQNLEMTDRSVSRDLDPDIDHEPDTDMEREANPRIQKRQLQQQHSDS